MSFRIHSDSLPLKQDLKKRLAGLEGQLEEGFDYEISAEMLPREQALDRARELAQHTGAESVFVSESVFTVEKPQEEDPDFAMGLPTVTDQQRATGEGSAAEQTKSPETIPAPEVHSPRIDAQKIRDAAVAKAAHAGATLRRTGEHTASALKITQKKTATFLQVVGSWAARRGVEAKAASGELQRRLAAKSTEWKMDLAKWNARRRERLRIESEARAERERAAHREAELAAMSAQVMIEQRRKEEAARRSAEAVQPKAEPKPASRPAPQPQPVYRDTWPVWRSAFVVAACIALVGIFLLATGGKQSNATPATSTELSKPTVVVPAQAVEHVKAQQVAPAVALKVPEKVAAPPVARKRVARTHDEDEDLQEVTVRNYRIAPSKKDAKGVTQISDME